MEFWVPQWPVVSCHVTFFLNAEKHTTCTCASDFFQTTTQKVVIKISKVMMMMMILYMHSQQHGANS